MRDKNKKICRLCGSDQTGDVLTGEDGRIHFLCGECLLINTEARYFLSKEEEKKRYLLHENSPQDKGYLNFLMQAVSPALRFLTKGMNGLDYGCGPGPAISVLLEERGYDCQNYDPFFFKDTPQKKPGFIFATEVIEHFFFPAEELGKLKELLEPGGILVLMTQRWKEKDTFSTWYYARDDSHVSFYHTKTFDFIAETFGLEKLFDDGERVVIFKKPACTCSQSKR